MHSPFLSFSNLIHLLRDAADSRVIVTRNILECFERKLMKTHHALFLGLTAVSHKYVLWQQSHRKGVKNSSEIVFSPRIRHWPPTQLSIDLQHIRANQSIQVTWVYGCAPWQVVQGGSLWQEKFCCHGGMERWLKMVTRCIAVPQRT